MVELFLTRLLPISCVLLLLGWLLQLRIPRLLPHVAAVLWQCGGGVLLACFGMGLLFRLTFPAAIDAVEATVMDVSALFAHGHPMYTSIDAPERYSLLYGPFCFLPYSVVLRFGGAVPSLLYTLAAANVCLIGVLYTLFRKRLSPVVAVVATGFVTGALMMKGMANFMVRGDVWLTLGSAAALLATELRSKKAAVLLFAASSALVIDVKVTGLFYLIIPLLLLRRRHGTVAVASAAVVTMVLVLAPFCSSLISLPNYVAWLREAAHHPLSPKLFSANCLAVGLLLGPIAILLLSLRSMSTDRFSTFVWRNRYAAMAFALSIAGSLLTGSKTGAGRPHLNPTFIVSAWLAVLLWQHVQQHANTSRTLQLGGLFYCSLLVVPAVLQVVDLSRICYQRRAYAAAVLGDLQHLTPESAGRSVEIGYVRNGGYADPVNSLSLFEPQLSAHGEPVLVDVGALFDMGLSGLPLPDTTIQAMNTCSVDTWLLPKGNTPFQQVNIYAYDVPKRFPDPLVFDERFRRAFSDAYSRVASGSYYDVWKCRVNMPS